MTDIASLGVKVTSSGVDEASTSLDKLTNSAQGAETATENVGKASESAGEGMEEFVKHARNHVLSLLNVTEDTRAYIAIAAHVAPAVLGAAAAFAVINRLLGDSAEVTDSLARALAQTNNAAGATLPALTVAVGNIAKSGISATNAAQAIASLVSTTKVGAENLEEFGEAAAGANKAFGTSFDDLAKNFSAIADGPVAAVRALRLLTPELEKQIEDLETSGDVTGAVTLAQRTYAQSLQDQRKQFEDSESTYTRFWDSIRDHAQSAWTAMLHPVNAASSVRDSIQQALANALGGVSGSPLLGPIAGAQTPNDLAANQAEKDRAAAAAKLAQDRADAAAIVANADSITAGNIALTASIQGVTASLALNTQAFTSDASVIEQLHGAGLLNDRQYYDTRQKLIAADTAAQVDALNKQIALIQQQQSNDDKARALEVAKSRDNLTPQGAANTQSLEDQRSQASAQSAARVSALRDQINQVQASGAQKVTQATVDQAAATERLNLQLQQVAESSQLFVKDLQSQYDIEEASVALSDTQAQRLSSLADIQKHFDEARQQINKSASKGTISPEQAADALAIQNKAQADAEASFAAHNKRLDDLNGDWVNGAKKAFADYEDAANNAAANTDQAVTAAFGQIEDSIVSATTTGKFSFKSLADSILADLVRMETKVIESWALKEIFGSIFPGAGAASVAGQTAAQNGELGFPMAAKGGPISGPTIVGEKGPELFVPNQSGTIIPNGKWEGSGGGGVNITNYNSFGPGSDVASIQSQLDQRDDQLRSDIYNRINRGEWRPALKRGSK